MANGLRIYLSAKALAYFMTARPAMARKLLRGFKYPDPEGRQSEYYYRDAREIVRAYHAGGHGAEWLEEQAKKLSSLGAALSGPAAARHENNARALRQYAAAFGERKLEILQNVRLRYRHAGVVVVVRPDLHAAEGRRERLVELDFSEREREPRVERLLVHIMAEAAVREGMTLSPSGVQYWHVPSGDRRAASRARTRLEQDVEAACETIAAVWGTL